MIEYLRYPRLELDYLIFTLTQASGLQRAGINEALPTLRCLAEVNLFADW